MKEFSPEGPVNLSTVSALSSMLLAAATPDGMVVNLTGVTEVDSSSLALLIAARRAVEAAGGVFEVKEVPDAIKTLASLYGVNFIVDNAAPHD
jgi:phospholipid transport system transporter-binding protein